MNGMTGFKHQQTIIVLMYGIVFSSINPMAVSYVFP